MSDINNQSDDETCHLKSNKNRLFNHKQIWKEIDQNNTQKNSINYLLEFRDPHIQSQFINFKMTHYSRAYFTYPIATSLTVLFTIYWVIAYINGISTSILINSLFTFVVVLPLLWFMTYLKQSPKRYPLEENVRLFYFVENAFLIVISVGIGSTLITRTLHGECRGSTFLELWTCSPQTPCKTLTGNLSLIFIFVPLLCTKTLPSISTKVLIAVYLWTLAIMAVEVVVVDAIISIPYVFLAFAITLLLLAILTQTRLHLFLYFLEIEDLQRKRDEMATRLNHEIRNLIGKVAHDIRTVS